MARFGRHGSYGLGDMKKVKFEAQYLGWKPCQTMVFDDSVLALTKEIWCERQADTEATNIMHIQLSQKELKIVQYISRFPSRSASKTEKYRFPPIPSNDITFAQQCSPPELVATIILGYSSTSKQYLHVHVFRFNSESSATAFVNSVMDIVNQQMNKKRLAKIRDVLIEEGHLSPNVANAQQVSSGVRTIDVDQEDAMNSLAMELRRKLRPNPSQPDPSRRNAAPLLLPPRDYDTISRSHGDAIRHRQAMLAEKEELEKNQPEVVDSVPVLNGPADSDYDMTTNPGSNTPSSSGSGTPRHSGRGAVGLSRHSFGSADSDKGHHRYTKRNQIPFRANESTPANVWQGYKQN